MTNPLPSIGLNRLKLVPQELYQGRPLWSYSAGKRIPLYKEEVYVIQRGVVWTQDLDLGGEEFLVGMIGPKMPFSSSLTSSDSYEVYALSPVVDLIRLSWSEIQSSEALMRELNRMLIQRVQYAEALLAIRSKRQSSERLIRFLSFLSQEYGHRTSQGVRLEVYLTHRQIANALGITRVTTTRLLGVLKKASLIKISPNRCFYITDELIDYSKSMN